MIANQILTLCPNPYARITAWKVSVFGVYLGRLFPNSD